MRKGHGGAARRRGTGQGGAVTMSVLRRRAEARSWTAAALRARALLDETGEGGAMASRDLDWSYI